MGEELNMKDDEEQKKDLESKGLNADDLIKLEKQNDTDSKPMKDEPYVAELKSIATTE